MRGCLRTRLILDSARVTIIGGLTQLGWFDRTVHDVPPGARRHRPLRYIPAPLKWDEAIEPNALAISAEDTTDQPAGLGGEVEDTIELYVDIYAQSDPLGWQLAIDVRDIAIGKFPELGRTGPVIDVYDLRQATPAPFTSVGVENVIADRSQGQAREYQAHWFMVRVDLIDEYHDEQNTSLTGAPWTESHQDAWGFVQAAFP